MSKVVVFGFSGYAGGAITRELVSRGHEVLGVSRTAPSAGEQVAVRAGSVFDEALVREVAAGADHLVVALHAQSDPALATALPALTAAAIAEGATLSFVGGAGSLRVSENGPRLFETPDFPEAYLPEARAHGAILDTLRESPAELDWFYVSPAAEFGAWAAGERTGSFRIGGDVLLTAADGSSTISGADYAIAYVDEIERGEHRRARFSVAY
ncbi:MAG: NAD(P)-dependent oxidoreductase [Leucobacter sp.]